jgi:hypothetical protein
LGVPVVADRGEDEPCRAGVSVGREPLGGLLTLPELDVGYRLVVAELG